MCTAVPCRHRHTHTHCKLQFVEAMSAVAYEGGMSFEEVMECLGCMAPRELSPNSSMVSGLRGYQAEQGRAPSRLPRNEAGMTGHMTPHQPHVRCWSKIWAGKSTR